MNTTSLKAHFDGEKVCLDEPCTLEKNTRLIVTILSDSKRELDENPWSLLAINGLSKAFSDEEPEYTTECIQEQNPAYEGR